LYQKVERLSHARGGASNHRQTSPASIEYNCVAWAAGDTEHWWQPGVHWPAETPAEQCGIGALEDAFKALDFEPCGDDGPEPGEAFWLLFLTARDPRIEMG